MPELPEVEVTRSGLTDRLQGARILSARLGKPLRWPMGRDPTELAGGRIGALQRRGKYLWMPIDGLTSGRTDGTGAAEGGLLIHLGMSGSLGWHAQAMPAGAHDHFDLQTDRGLLRLNDPRRFGAVVWSDGRDREPALRLLSTLGPEPFDPALTAEVLRAHWRGKRAPVKAALLAGDAVVGVGNIYASEALYRAGIDPRTPCGRLGPVRCGRLLAAVREVLSQAIALGGSTLRDFRDAHGMSGAFQQAAGVYGRAGAPCGRCGGAVRRLVQGQRATYWCPGCQRR